jgi:hypothetical protein
MISNPFPVECSVAVTNAVWKAYPAVQDSFFSKNNFEGMTLRGKYILDRGFNSNYTGKILTDFNNMYK